MRKHLIHIGYPKAASTFIQEWFRQHPQIRFSIGGLAGFHNVFEIASEAARGQDRKTDYYVTSYEGLTDPRQSSGSLPVEYGLKEFGGSVPTKASQREVCETLKSIFPESKILIITRGFKSYCVSGYSQYVRCGGRMIVSDFISQVVGSEESKSYSYDYLIDLYLEAFGEENVILLPFELLRDKRDEFLKLIENALGLDHFDEDVRRLNESISPEEMYWYPRISSRVANLAIKLGRPRFDKFYSWYIHHTIRNRLRFPIKLLTRWKPEMKVMDSDFPDELFEGAGEKATILRDRPLYKPYLAEYFLD